MSLTGKKEIVKFIDGQGVIRNAVSVEVKYRGGLFSNDEYRSLVIPQKTYNEGMKEWRNRDISKLDSKFTTVKDNVGAVHTIEWDK